MKQQHLEITNEQITQELSMWFNHEESETLARETGFIQRSTGRLTGSRFFNLMTVEILDEPTISYEGLCDLLEERDLNLQITPQALCERINSVGAVGFLKAGLEKDAVQLEKVTQAEAKAPHDMAYYCAASGVLG